MTRTPPDGVNVLLTSAAHQTFLVEGFRAALGAGGRVFTADAATLPARTPSGPKGEENALLTPPPDHPGYVAALLALCRERRISLLVPLGDAELLPLARAKAAGAFAPLGVEVAVSAEAVVGLGFDRWASYRVLRYRGVPVPNTFRSLESAYRALGRGELVFPLVLKPRWLSDLGPDVVYGEQELELSYRRAEQRLAKGSPSALILVQQFVRADEFELDVLNDLRGEYVTTLARQKLGRRAGETDSAVTAEDETLRALGETLSRALRHVGALTVDLFYDGQTALVLGLSARLGEGYALSHAAGADLPAALLAWSQGKEPEKRWLRTDPGVTVAKYSELMRLPKPPQNPPRTPEEDA